MKTYEKGLVSVIIPTYKRSDLLQKAIDSVLNQTYRKIQLIVVNDNTIGDEYSQKLYKLIDNIQDDRLLFLEQEKHINGAAARNCGIRAAKGEFIAFLDDDDYWDANKLEVQLERFAKLDNSWGAVACLIRQYNNQKLSSVSLPYKEGNLLMPILCRTVGLGTGAVLIRREALDDAGYFDETLMRHQDLQLFAGIAAKNKIALVKKYLHNIEIKDAQNRPSAEKMAAIKKAYFQSISPIMNSLSAAKQKQVHIMNEFECAYSYYRAGQKKKALKSTVGIFRSPATLLMAAKKVIKRILSRRGFEARLKKYS